MRYKILRWLRKNVFHVKEGEISPKGLYFIYYILFPLNWFYEKQSWVKYEPLTDVYTIRGMKFTGAVFETLKDEANKGFKFELVDTGEYVTIRSLRGSEV